MTYEQFQQQYGRSERAYEFWYGKAILKGMSTIIHGLLQIIIAQLLREAGFISASDVELRIQSGARPCPDLIARKSKLQSANAAGAYPSASYPVEAWDVLVEILSEDDSYLFILEKCRNYQTWGFGMIYLVNPAERSVVEFKNGQILPCDELASIPVSRIWTVLDEQYSG